MQGLEDRIEVLLHLKDLILPSIKSPIKALIDEAYIKNPWFTPESSTKALNAIAEEYLDKNKLLEWLASYDIREPEQKRVGLVLAGNIPLVGFHDVLVTFLTGHKALLKCSSKDDVFIPGLVEIMTEIDGRVSSCFEKIDRLKNFDAVIATGGETAAVHFKYYFRDYPHIIRKNRHGVAVLSGNENRQELMGLGHDIFDYFGLGCRSVSKIYVPGRYSFDGLFEAFSDFKSIIDHHKYKNNYDYNNAIYLMGQEAFLTNDFIILKEDKSLGSRIACLHYEYYDDFAQLEGMLFELSGDIQCISTSMDLKNRDTVPLGKCQIPALSDFADGVDTINFLTHL